MDATKKHTQLFMYKKKQFQKNDFFFKKKHFCELECELNFFRIIAENS
jgi:hypothetical protein